MDVDRIADPTARAFAAALLDFETSTDPSELAGLFAADATLSRLDARGDRTDVAAFWQEYRDQFDALATEFTHATGGDGRVALEWISRGTLTGGREITYRGVTVLDVAGERVGALRTYYDSAAFTAIPAGTR